MGILLKHWVTGVASGGINWSSFWATLISATVENAAPTHVVLTFPSAKTELGASDFTIAGFTVSSASWTGAVLTLVVSYAVTAYAGNLTITFVTTGGTAIVTNNVAIANTVGWYVAGDGSSTYVTKDGSDFVSVWKDLSGANHPLNQATGTNQPKWESDGVLFDGVDNFLRAAAFTYNQPEMAYLVINQVSWGNFDVIIDGNASNVMKLYQLTATPSICLFNNIAANTNLPLNTFKILRIKWHGANSSIQVADSAATTGSTSGNAGGLTVGCVGDLGIYYSNIKIKEAILRNTDDNAATQTAIYNYLANKYGFATI